MPESYESLKARLDASHNGIIPGRFPHNCQEEDIMEEPGTGGAECRVCGCWVDDPYNRD